MPCGDVRARRPHPQLRRKTKTIKTRKKYETFYKTIPINGGTAYCLCSGELWRCGFHFDGNGHAIVGLHNTLFGYMYGTVKNLAIIDCDIYMDYEATALARYVGGTNNNAEVSNCYISGVISAAKSYNTDCFASGLCYLLAEGSSIHDCYFKGLFAPQNNDEQYGHKCPGNFV